MFTLSWSSVTSRQATSVTRERHLSLPTLRAFVDIVENVPQTARACFGDSGKITDIALTFVDSIHSLRATTIAHDFYGHQKAVS